MPLGHISFTRPYGYYALISSSPVPLPQKRRRFVAAPMDSPGGSPPCRAGRPWTTILWEKSHAAPTSSPPQDSLLPAPTFSRRCLNRLGKRPSLLVFHASSRRRYFYGTILRTVHRSLAMVDFTLLELPTLRGSRILSDEQVSNGV